jgi:hypothetical protein
MRKEGVMKTLAIATSLVAAIGVASAFAVYEVDDSQHRKPSTPPAGQAQAPATPREGGHTAPPNAPKTDETVPRSPANARNESAHPRRPPERGPVVVPYPVGPWWGPYPYPTYGGWRVFGEWQYAQVPLDVTPRDAQVYVDRYPAGVVDDYDGVFQHLAMPPGAHFVEIRKIGYRSLAIELNLYPGESITYRRVMEPSSTDALESCSPASALPPGVEEGAAPRPVDLSVRPGDVKFDVTPKDAEIYLDGFYAGIVNDFNGSQHLQVAAGRHHVSLKMAGYEPIEVELSIESDRMITYRTTMKELD